MNSIKIQGRLTKDPEQKVGSSGAEYCKFTVAVDRKRSKDKAVDFFDCTAFQQTGAFVSKYFAKGDGIIVSGRMESDKFTDKEGVKRTTWGITVEDVEFPLGKGRSEQSNTAPSEADTAAANDGDLPF